MRPTSGSSRRLNRGVRPQLVQVSHRDTGVDMKKLIAAFVAVSTSMTPKVLLAAESGSSAYGAGRLVGYVFLAVLAFLIIRKLMKK